MSKSKSRTSRSSSLEDERSLIGTTVGGRYLVESLLGQGGMGAVYLIQHLAIRKRMALKVLSGKMTSVPTVVARFEREATLAAHLDHPNVVSASDYGCTEDGRFYLVLEYVEGKELRDVLDQLGRPLPPARAFHIARQVASALCRSQALGIVHRDLKPENIMLIRRDGSDDFVKVLDFGLALLSRHIESTGEDEHTAKTAPKITQVGEIFGTPAYMAPEQTIGAATDIRTDLYALGAVLYEMLTGERPFVGPSALAYIQQHLAVPAPAMKDRAPRVSVPQDMEALVQRLLAKQPAQRFQTPEQLIEAIDQVGAAHNLDWPGRSSPSLSSVSRRSQSSSGPPSGQALIGLSQGLGRGLEQVRAAVSRTFGWVRSKVAPKPKPRDKIGQALDVVRTRLGLQKRRRFPPLALTISGAAVLVTLLIGMLLYSFR